MLTDGALRMLVLLNFHLLGFSPIQLAYLFLIYEFMGILTNFFGGWLVNRFGLIPVLYSGLTIQVLSLLGLVLVPTDVGIVMSAIFVMVAQGFSGMAKDLTKVSSKSAVKILTPKSSDQMLFRWVAILTGSKNAMKGFGFLLGGFFLGFFGYRVSIAILIVILIAVFVGVILSSPSVSSNGIKSVKFRSIISSNRRINFLSMARLFLFGARDTWFVVGIPIYFLGVFEGAEIFGEQSAFFLVGGYMAIWIILYGAVQAYTHKIFAGFNDCKLNSGAMVWIVPLPLVPLFLAFTTYIIEPQSIILTILLIVGLLIFGAIFAVNSSLHSFLILKFTTLERVSLDVGFYYMANAAGRLLGTLLSGLSFQVGGLSSCLIVSAIFLLAATFFTWCIPITRK